MITVKSKALEKEVRVDREIGRFTGKEEGPTLIFMAGIHGNEPSGVFALLHILNYLRENVFGFRGEFIALSGNLRALEKGQRYIAQDLNRIWQAERIETIKKNGSGPEPGGADFLEQIEIYRRLQTIFDNSKPPFYLIDLHTTSSHSCPFITIGDTIRNREYALHFPVPIILGIEEFLDGPLLSYINEVGPVAMGFEAGHHDALSSIENHISFIWLALVFAGCISNDSIPFFAEHLKRLKQSNAFNKRVFEICYRYGVRKNENFTMLPGYFNFQSIRRGQLLARSENNDIVAPRGGRIFMPLYQKQGDDGFFVIAEIRMFWLRLSAKLRRLDVDRYLMWLPGIKPLDDDPHTFRVNRRIARWLVVDFFHLLGFRRMLSTERHHFFTRRKYDIREPEIYSF